MTSTQEQDPRVDELRQRLRSLGYLHAGVDRFVLAPAHGARGPAAIALLASLRVGALAALLLGPATAIGIGGRMSGLVTGPRDAIVLAIYMGALLGIAIAGAGFAASLLVAWLARRTTGAVERRARPAAFVAGIVVALLTLVYLTLWWQTASAGPGWSSPVWTVFALAVAASISVLLGHAVTVTALAVIAAGTGPAVNVRGVPGASWRWSVSAAIVAFCGAAALLVLSAPASSASEAPPPLTVVSSGTRVRVLAIDGFDPGIFEELAAAGRLPALDAALAGARTSLRAVDSQPASQAVDPARAWTTVATGQPPSAHGVQGLETTRVAGVQGAVPASTRSPVLQTVRAATDLLRLTRPALASGAERQEKTFWEIAADAGLRSAVVNWWATWPAASDASIVLTDRATLRLERGGELNAEIAPAALYPQLQQRWPELLNGAIVRAARAVENPPDDTQVEALIRRSAELDAIQLALATEVATDDTDLVAVYLPGLDIVQHALLGADSARITSSSIAARLGAVESYYEILDRLARPVLAAGRNELLLVITAPGRVGAPADGMMGATGAFVRAEARLLGAATDVAPTILYALGVPVSRTLAGRPLTQLFSEEFAAKYPVRLVETYGRPAEGPAVQRGKPLDEEMIDRLRSLGYVR